MRWHGGAGTILSAVMGSFLVVPTFLAALLLVGGCSGSLFSEAGAGPDADAGMDASRPLDSGSRSDAEQEGIDAGAFADAGGQDGGDEGRSDAGPQDAGRWDSGPPATGALEDLPTCSVLSALDLSVIDPPGAGSGGYVVPSSRVLTAAEAAARAVGEGRWTDALAQASRAEYVLCRGATGAERDLVLLAPMPPNRGWARAVVRVGPAARELLLEAPHPIFDRNTLSQSVELFERLRARALIASGTHRCASTVRSSCDGRTSVCTGTSDPYPVSDVAHAADSTFHRHHVGLAESLSSTVVISVHGMSRAGVSLSDGTGGRVGSASPVRRLAAGLLAEGVAGVTSCNEGAGVPVETHLCGGTNVQGRHLHGSPDACTVAASTSSHRFVHMEQSGAVRADRDAMTRALERAFP